MKILLLKVLKSNNLDNFYLPRTLINKDLVLGEDTLSKFDNSYMLEMYMETTEGWKQGEQELVSKFGLEIREDTTFVLLKEDGNIKLITKQQQLYQVDQTKAI